MKILFVSHSSIIEYHQQKLEILASKYGHEITLCTPPYWYEGGVKTKAFIGGNIKYIIGNVMIVKSRAIQIYMNASEIIKKINPDIIHVEEEPFTAPAWQFIGAAKKAGKKSLFFTWENIKRGHNSVFTHFDDFSLKNSNGAIAGNLEAKEILRAKKFLGPIEVMPQYGINMQDFVVRKGPNDKENFTLGYIGRIIPEKGIDTLIESLVDLPDVKLIIAGNKNAKYMNYLKQIIDKNGIKDRITFVGFLDRLQTAQFISSIDALVLPSVTTPQWKEQFGRVLIEAFASKTVVIGSSSGEIPNVIFDAGFIFKEKNVRSLKECIIKLKSDPLLYNILADKGYKRAQDNYTNDIIAERLDDFYKQL